MPPTEGQVGPITDQTAESFAATFETNVLGVVLSMKHEVRASRPREAAASINISSTYGHRGRAPMPRSTSAQALPSKHSKSVALELAKSGSRERPSGWPHGHRHA